MPREFGNRFYDDAEEEDWEDYPEDDDDYPDDDDWDDDDWDEDDDLDDIRQSQHSMDQKIEELRQLYAQPAAEQPAPEVSYNDLILSDPDAFVEQIEKRLSKKYEADLAQRDQAAAQQQFFSNFATKHPDLAEDMDIVEATLRRNQEDLLPMSVPDAMDALADMTRERLGFDPDDEGFDDEDLEMDPTHTEMGGISYHIGDQPSRKSKGPVSFSDILRASKKEKNHY